MKRSLAVFAAAVLGALVLLLRLVALPPPTPEVAESSVPSSRTSEPAIVMSRELPSDRRVEVAKNKPIEPGLPPWTVMLATMPASVPPQARTLPDIPAGALVPTTRPAR